MEARKLENSDFDILKNAKPFSSFSVNNTKTAKEFYGDTLGLDIRDSEMGTLELSLSDGNEIFIYPKEDHIPATFTVLNFQVPNVEEAVEQLTKRGIKFEQYGGDIKTNSKGIHKDKEHTMAWFKDPAGNVLSVMG